MKDPQSGPTQGRTRWRRFAALMVPAAAVAGAVVFGMANGAIAASFAVSGQTFKVSADKLVGEGFVQYGGVDHDANGNQIPVAISGIEDAELTNLCQSVKVPNMPIVLRIEAGAPGGAPATAHNLLIDMNSLEGDATFTNINIGQDASTLNAAGNAIPAGTKGQFGQQAEKVVITNLRQVAISTSAGTFTLNGLKLGLKIGGGGECF